MLLEFRIRNFRSFKDESVLSLLASNDTALIETNTIATKIPSLPHLLPSSVVYGANASGKSNLLRGLLLMKGIVIESAALQPNQLFNVQPFRLDEPSKSLPTLFEVTVLIEGVRYQYGFEFTPSQIVSEWLYVYQKAKPQKWFERRSENTYNNYEFSSHLVGQKKTWQEATRPNSLFLSMAVQLNSEQLRPLFSWFANNMHIFLAGGAVSFETSINMIRTDLGKERIAALLNSADTSISSVKAETTAGIHQTFRFDVETGKSETQRVEGDMWIPKFRHEVDGTSVDFDLVDESEGTQKIFSLGGPLYDILEKGSLIVIDELDRSLHPLLVQQIVKTFHDPIINTHGAQLIFSTHDTSLLDNSSLLRRDQVWFTEKDEKQSSQLVPLIEFSPRKGEALEKNYLGGRYGGVPVLGDRLLTRSAGAKG